MTKRLEQENGNEQPTVGADKGDDLCRSTMSGELGPVTDSALIVDPWVVDRGGSRFEIWGKRENQSIFPWGFWGGVVAAGAATMLVLSYSSLAGPSTPVLLSLMATIIVGTGLFKTAKRSRLQDELLCEIDRNIEVLSWPTKNSTSLVAVAFGDVESVMFESTRFPVPKSKSGSHLDAAALKIRDEQGREIPVIEVSTSQTEAHKIARMLAKILGLNVDYVGTGVRDWV